MGLMKEIWEKTAKVAQIKKKLEMTVNEDVLVNQLKQTQQKLDFLLRSQAEKK